MINNRYTFIMPFRIDSNERKRNLEFVLHWLCPLGAHILLLEADNVPRIESKSLDEHIEYEFIKDDNPIFHRTHYINQLLHKAQSEIVSIWDTDIITSYGQIEEAINNIRAGAIISYPYNGEFIMLTRQLSEELIKRKKLEYVINQRLLPIFRRPFCGGAFFVNRNLYLSNGGENEHFTGWGPEDAERLRRVQIMGYQVKWTEKGKAYHLFHPRKENSRFFDENAAIEMRKELVKVCCMNREELYEYIKTLTLLRNGYKTFPPLSPT